MNLLKESRKRQTERNEKIFQALKREIESINQTKIDGSLKIKKKNKFKQ